MSSPSQPRNKLCWACQQEMPGAAMKCTRENCGEYQDEMSMALRHSEIARKTFAPLLTIIGWIIAFISSSYTTTNQAKTIHDLSEDVRATSTSLSALREQSIAQLDNQTRLLGSQIEETNNRLEAAQQEVIKLKNVSNLVIFRGIQQSNVSIPDSDFLVRQFRSNTDKFLKEAASPPSPSLTLSKPFTKTITIAHSGSSNILEGVFRSYEEGKFEFGLPNVQYKDVVGFHVKEEYSLAELKVQHLNDDRYLATFVPIHKDAIYNTNKTRSMNLDIVISAYILTQNSKQ